MLCGGNGSGKTTALNIIAESIGAKRVSPYNKSAFFAEYVAGCKPEFDPGAAAAVCGEQHQLFRCYGVVCGNREAIRPVPAWVYYDSYSARYFVEEMQMQGFNMVRCIQGAKTLSLPMQMLGVDLQAHKVIYNNNPVLKWCLTNTGVQTDRNGNIVPIKNQSPKQRIDGTAALLDCYVGLYEHYTEYTSAI